MKSLLLQIESSKDNYFESALEIYDISFPLAERQPLDRIIERVESGKCKMYVVLINDNLVVGMALLWNFSECQIMLLDYFAITPSYRNQGLGKLFLEQINSKVISENKILGLEIEHPKRGNNMSQRISRMNFYLDKGAKILTNVKYSMPALDGSEDIEMLLLLLVNARVNVNASELKNFLINIYSKVYLLDKESILVKNVLSKIPNHIKLSATL
jgi:hypothetical protein